MHGLPTHRPTRSSSPKSELWWAIIITTMALGLSWVITTITPAITTTIITTKTKRVVLVSHEAGSLAGPAFRRAQQIAIGAVEDGIGV